MAIKKKIFIIISSIMLLLSIVAPVFADNPSQGAYNTPGGTCINGLYNSGLLKGMPCDKPIDDLDYAKAIAVNVIKNFALPITGVLFLIMFLYGAVTYITSAGTPARVEKGKKILTAAIVGLILVIFAEVLVGLFASMLGGGVQ